MTTKELARHLGLIRKRRKEKSLRVSLTNSGQEFSYLVVIDFESTCWDDGKSRSQQEIIEFPAVLVNTRTGHIESEFHHFVLPIENPTLSPFCINFTGVTQDQVEAGIPIGTCLYLFNQWVHRLSQDFKLVFHGAPDGGAFCAVVTWTDWDLGVCLEQECKRKMVRKPEVLSSWIDLKALYKKFYCRQPQGLLGALHDTGLDFIGRQHCGMDDAKNTAFLAWKMIKDGCQLHITSGRTIKDQPANLAL